MERFDHTIIRLLSQRARYNGPLIGDTNEPSKVFAGGLLFGNRRRVFPNFVEYFRHELANPVDSGDAP